MIEIIPNWHPIFVHFTVALFSIATLFYLLSHITQNSELQVQWYNVAKWNLWFGAIITVLTVIAGWQAYNTVDHDTPSHLAMTNHRNWAMATFAIFLVLAIWSFVQDRAGKTRNWFFVGLLVIACGALASTAWRGGEVVYRYGLGVMSLPKVEGEGHDHVHANGEGHGSATGSAGKKDTAGAGSSHDDSSVHHKDSITSDIDDHHDDGHGEPGHHDNDKKTVSKPPAKPEHKDDGHTH